MPVAIKDNIWVKGRRVTQGSKLFRDFIAPEDAIAVARLEAAGAVIVGMANTSEFAAKGSTVNPLHGATRNPHDLALTAGGSSGGPVAAVASGMVPLALGTDAGGSSRRPPAHTGLVGFKPSFGAVPYGPGFPEPFFAISCHCPIARTVAEARLVFAALVGPDPRDPHATFIAPDRDEDPRKFSIAYSPTWGLDVPIEPDIAASVARHVEALRAAGFTIVEKDPLWPEGTLWPGLASIQQAGLAALHGEAHAREPGAIDPDLASQIVGGAATSGPDVAKALLLSEDIAIAAARFFAENEVVAAIGPTTPCAAWPVEQLAPATIAGVSVGPRGHAVFTPMFNHARQPAISIPSGSNAQGLPIGMQLVAPRHQDWALLALAERVEAVWAKSPP